MVEAKAWRDGAVTEFGRLPHLYGNRPTRWEWLPSQKMRLILLDHRHPVTHGEF